MINLEQYREIIDEVYENYLTGVKEIDYNGRFKHLLLGQKPLSKEAFVERCKTDGDFSREWGLKIEENEFSLQTRMNIYIERYPNWVMIPEHDFFDTHNIPTKEINLYYKPKQSAEYVETYITILPTGSGFQQKNDKVPCKRTSIEIKIESMDPTGQSTGSKYMFYPTIDDPECQIQERLFLHIGDCLYRINSKGHIMETIIPKENN